MVKVAINNQNTTTTVKKKEPIEVKEFKRELMVEGSNLNKISRGFNSVMLGFFTFYLGLFKAESLFEQVLIAVFIMIAYILTSWAESYIASVLSYYYKFRERNPFAFYSLCLILAGLLVIPVFHSISIMNAAGENGHFLFPLILGMFLIPFASKITQGNFMKKVEDDADEESVTTTSSEVSENSEKPSESSEVNSEPKKIWIDHTSNFRNITDLEEFRSHYEALIPIVVEDLKRNKFPTMTGKNGLIAKIDKRCNPPSDKILKEVIQHYENNFYKTSVKEVHIDKDDKIKGLVEETTAKGVPLKVKTTAGDGGKTLLKGQQNLFDNKASPVNGQEVNSKKTNGVGVH